jgi:putative ABC transport system permease protein
MAVPLKYNLRNLLVRWRMTLATTLGIGLVVAVFVMVMALARGLKATYISTGDERNLLVLRRGSTAESSSQIGRDDARRIKYISGIERNERNEPLASAEIVVLINIPRVGTNGAANVLVRGLGPVGLELRPNIHIVEGRMFQKGLNECIVSRKIAERFANCHVGESFVSGRTTWHVVGMFDAHKTAYDSEIWVDADEARDAFKRDFYGSSLFRPANETLARLMVEREDCLKALDDYKQEAGKRLSPLKRLMMWWHREKVERLHARVAELNMQISSSVVGRIEKDRILQVRVLPETDYYKEQTKQAGPIQFVGGFLATIMSIGAAFSAMNTMYATVGARTREVGTLRVLGFKRRDIYLSFMFESIVLALIGGVLGCLLSLPLNGLATGTFSWTTFAEIAFEFHITPELLAKGMTFALVMGVLGGLLPARLAARKPVLDALRSV